MEADCVLLQITATLDVDGYSEFLDEDHSVWDDEERCYYFCAYTHLDFYHASADVDCEVKISFSDDGSLDFSIENIERYIHEKKQKNIIDFKVIRHQKNVGTVKNLNEAYSQCIGKYVLQFAADDALYDSEVLAQFSRAFNNVSKETIGVFARSLDCDENLVWTGKEYLAMDKAEYFSLLTAEEQYRKFIYRCDIHMGSTVFIMDKLREILPLDQKYHLLDDWPLILRITRGGGRFSFTDFKALLFLDRLKNVIFD